MFESSESQKRTELKELGEFGLIDLLSKHVEIKQPSTLKGIGDDAAVLDYSKGKTLVSTDMLVEGVHFDLSYVPLKHLGYKAVAVNLSDIYAMNGIPKHITVSIALSNRFSVEAIEELYAGILLACGTYEVDLIGGDTTSTASGLIISITAIGEAQEDQVVYRDGAKDTNLLVVSGDLGGAYMGLQILEREKVIFEENSKESLNVQPDLTGMEYILERQLKPESRKDVIEELARLKIKPNAMIDVSDGLASELIHLGKAAKLGVAIHEDKLPIDQQTFDVAREMHLDPTMCAMNGGEDYELLMAVDLKDYDLLKVHPMFTVIGYFTPEEEGFRLIAKGGSSHPIEAQGWNSFKSESE